MKDARKVPASPGSSFPGATDPGNSPPLDGSAGGGGTSGGSSPNKPTRTLLAPEGDQIAAAKTTASVVRKRKDGVKVMIPEEIADIASRLDLQTYRVFYSIAKLQKAGLSVPEIIKATDLDPELTRKILESPVYNRMYAEMRSVDSATPELDAMEQKYREFLPEIIDTELYWLRRRGVNDGHVSLRAAQQMKQGAGVLDSKGNINQVAAIVNIKLTDELTGRLEKANVLEDD